MECDVGDIESAKELVERLGGKVTYEYNTLGGLAIEINPNKIYKIKGDGYKINESRSISPPEITRNSKFR